jgi:hypothetical protein
VHTHFLRDDTRGSKVFVRGPRGGSARPAGIPELVGKPQTIDDLKYPNWFKESFWTATPRWR